uniref:Ig-like domain-containing protein n=1 Tax=Varanus komodoensis TaxID=61221 RepID=A0A8D2Q852_VARKO
MNLSNPLSKPPQLTFECRFSNATGQEQVRYLESYIYERAEIVCFDSAQGRYEALTPLVEPLAKDLNSRKEGMGDRRNKVDIFCWHNYGVAAAGRVVGRRVQPTITISPTKDDPLSPRTLLLCTAASFYPREIEVRWLKNGWELLEGVFYGEESQNVDWMYQTQVMLEAPPPQHEDVYTWQVEHTSLELPITRQLGMARLPAFPGCYSWELSRFFSIPELVLIFFFFVGWGDFRGVHPGRLSLQLYWLLIFCVNIH